MIIVKVKTAIKQRLTMATSLLSFLLILFFNVFQVLAQTPVNDYALVNTPYDEHSPVISPDGKQLYLTLANHEQNLGGKSDQGDIWISTKTEMGWTAPVHAGNVINNRGYNAVLGFSTDGKQIFLANHYTTNGEVAKTQGFSFAYKTSAGWTAPQNIYIPYFLNKSQHISGTIRDDVFIFSAESYSSYGAEDLYITFKNGNGWSEPMNLGRSLNTSFQELSPWLAEDKRTLYFASNAPSGYGSFDIYQTTRMEEGWTAWTKPINLGTEINSEARELYYRKLPDGQILFTSTRNSDGYGNIKSMQDLSGDSTAKPKVAFSDSSKITHVSGLVTVFGKVTSIKSGQPIANAKLVFRTQNPLQVSTSVAGEFSIALPPGNHYAIEVEAASFINAAEKLELNTGEAKSLEMNFRLQPIEVGAMVNLKSVLFEQGTTKLMSESYDELDVVVDFLRDNPRVEIELEGHTDFRGDAKKNLQLSELRVQQIKNYLVSKGVSGKRIKGKGYGGQRPIANSDTEEARKLNRRVEFMITKN